MKTTFFKAAIAALALICVIFTFPSLNASGTESKDGGPEKSIVNKKTTVYENQVIPFNAVGAVTSGGGVQVYVNRLKPFMLDGTQVQFVQIYSISNGFIFARKGVTDNGVGRTEFVGLDISNGFLVYSPQKIRSCFSPDCGNGVSSEPNGNIEIAVGGGIGFCNPNPGGNACNCAGGYDCTFGITGGPVGLDDIILQ